MFCAFYDSLQVIIQSKHSISPMKLKGSFENEILEYLKVCIIKPICHKVETNLRLYAHSHLQMNEKNAYHLEIEDYLPIIKLKPIKLGDNYINIKCKILPNKLNLLIITIFKNIKKKITTNYIF